MVGGILGSGGGGINRSGAVSVITGGKEGGGPPISSLGSDIILVGIPGSGGGGLNSSGTVSVITGGKEGGEGGGVY